MLIGNFDRAHKKLSAIVSWENSRKASVEAELKHIEVTPHFIEG